MSSACRILVLYTIIILGVRYYLKNTIDVIIKLLVPCLESGTIILDPGTFIDFGVFLESGTVILLVQLFIIQSK